ncbi:glycosyltransferase family 2 protein [Halorubrum salinum]|uniref:glycosyltransferase family 2 protein n=1 Tax=Halorubrum salinum TaxID=767517 RepID=UPI002112DB15|nr:glycosyltransferase family 2 protein [Halorubrum salinum]
MCDSPQFSIISVYNDEEILSEFLLKGLRNQTCQNFEKILVNNSDGIYSSAASALNAGADDASGKYYVFIHQDVLLPPHYLEEAMNYLNDIGEFGIAGAVGVKGDDSVPPRPVDVNIIQTGLNKTSRESNVKNISDPAEVEAVDELLLIIPAKVFSKENFSQDICNGWHLYGIEFCLRMKSVEKQIITLPIELWHRDGELKRNWKHDLTLLRIINEYDNVDRIYVPRHSWPATRTHVIYRLLRNIPIINIVVRVIHSIKKNGLYDTLRLISKRLRRI